MSSQFFARGRSLWLSAIALLGVASAPSGQDVGYRGPALIGAGPTVGWPTATESKPQSKVWYNDLFWWASMWSPAGQAFHIHRLNKTTHEWVDTGTVVDSRTDSHSDALWDGTKLYIASHEYSTGPGAPGDPLLVLRFSYTPATDLYSLDAGFPVVIGDSLSEILVIDKDSTGTLWAVWKQAQRVRFTHTLGGSDTTWSKPAVVPTNTTDFASDDICSVIRFGNRIGVMWSDQLLNNFSFTTHVDGAADTDWSPVELALAGESDDHLHLEADAAGRVYAVVKNRANQIKLLRRSTTGVWEQFLVCDSRLDVSRPTMLLDEPANKLHVFLTNGNTAMGGTILQKTSALDVIAFDSTTTGTVIMQDASGLTLNNATSTKQNVTATMGLVVLASNTSKDGNSWHHEVPGVPTGNGLVLGPISPGTAGVVNTLVVTGATPRAMVTFYTGATLGSTLITRPVCPLGVTIGIARPFTVLGTVRATAVGVATLRTTPPLSLAGKTYHFQAIEPASCRASTLTSDRL